MENPNKYIITYSNHFEFNGKTFAFRKRELFDISLYPTWIPLKENNGSLGCFVNRKWLSKSVAKELASKMMPKEVDISSMEWNIQIIMDECFNLEQIK